MGCFEIARFEFGVFLRLDCAIEIFGSVFDLFKFTLAVRDFTKVYISYVFGFIKVLVVFEPFVDRGASAQLVY